MAFDKSKSSGDKGKPSGGPPKKPAGPKGPPQGAAGPPPDPVADPMSTGMGVQPPMPGTGMDPYAALMGQISNSAPMGMPMGGGMGGGPPMGGAGGMGGSMPHAPLQPGPPVDPLQHALMSGVDPMAMPPDIGQTWADPEGEQQQLSLNQLLTMLSLMQGGVSAMGADPGSRPGSATAGIIPAGMRGGF